jgi:hypothetical protein
MLEREKYTYTHSFNHSDNKMKEQPLLYVGAGLWAYVLFLHMATKSYITEWS